MTTHKCSHSIKCKSTECHHAKDHIPNGCDSPAHCGCWPDDRWFQPTVKCVPKENVKPAPDCPTCGMKESAGHNPGDCIARLKYRLDKAHDGIRYALKISDIWLPTEIDVADGNKARLVHCMRDRFLDVLEK